MEEALGGEVGGDGGAEGALFGVGGETFEGRGGQGRGEEDVDVGVDVCAGRGVELF